MKGLDDAGNALDTRDALEVTYKKSDCPDLNLYVNPVLEEEDLSNATETREINGEFVYYNRDNYKFVPTDYEKTADKLIPPGEYEAFVNMNEFSENAIRGDAQKIDIRNFIL